MALRNERLKRSEQRKRRKADKKRKSREKKKPNDSEEMGMAQAIIRGAVFRTERAGQGEFK
jgi:hypothetical protein